jgi:hypothetical protein
MAGKAAAGGTAVPCHLSGGTASGWGRPGACPPGPGGSAPNSLSPGVCDGGTTRPCCHARQLVRSDGVGLVAAAKRSTQPAHPAGAARVNKSALLQGPLLRAYWGGSGTPLAAESRFLAPTAISPLALPLLRGIPRFLREPLEKHGPLPRPTPRSPSGGCWRRSRFRPWPCCPELP